jgi:hypothetical protein
MGIESDASMDAVLCEQVEVDLDPTILPEFPFIPSRGQIVALLLHKGGARSVHFSSREAVRLENETQRCVNP